MPWQSSSSAVRGYDYVYHLKWSLIRDSFTEVNYNQVNYRQTVGSKNFSCVGGSTRRGLAESVTDFNLC